MLISTGKGDGITFGWKGAAIKLPPLSTRMFTRKDLNIDQFVKTLRLVNSGLAMEENVVREALRQFARYGFPGAPRGLEQQFQEVVCPSTIP